MHHHEVRDESIKSNNNSNNLIFVVLWAILEALHISLTALHFVRALGKSQGCNGSAGLLLRYVGLLKESIALQNHVVVTFICMNQKLDNQCCLL